MEAKELMRFDWVSLEDNDTPRQVDWIRSGEVGLFWGQVVTPPYLRPIPLTPEILEKNGFIKDAQKDEKSLVDAYHLLVPTGFERYSFTIQVSLYKKPICGVSTLVKCWGWTPPYNGGLNDIHLCSANYVHQLQHALRLCGIDKELII